MTPKERAESLVRKWQSDCMTMVDPADLQELENRIAAELRGYGEQTKMTPHFFSIYQDGIKVAGGYCPNRAAAEQMAAHYAMQYAQDGPVKVRIRKAPARKRKSVDGQSREVK